MSSPELVALLLLASTITFAVLYIRQLHKADDRALVHLRDTLERDYYEMGRNIRDEILMERRDVEARFKEIEHYLTDKDCCPNKTSSRPR
jgi:hypothetical protein